MDVTTDDYAVVRYTFSVSVPDLSQYLIVSHNAVTMLAHWIDPAYHIFAITFTHTALRVTTQVEPEVLELHPAQFGKVKVQLCQRYDLWIETNTSRTDNLDLSVELFVTASEAVNVCAFAVVGDVGATVVRVHVIFQTEITYTLSNLRHVTPPE